MKNYIEKGQRKKVLNSLFFPQMAITARAEQIKSLSYVSYQDTGSQRLERSCSAFPGHKQRARLEADMPGHKQVPRRNTGARGCGISHVKTWHITQNTTLLNLHNLHIQIQLSNRIM